MMQRTEGIPTAADVVEHLNHRFALRGMRRRVEGIAVLPYVNPMWLANWELPDAELFDDPRVVEEEIREARWLFPQVLQEF